MDRKLIGLKGRNWPLCPCVVSKAIIINYIDADQLFLDDRLLQRVADPVSGGPDPDPNLQ